MPAAFTSPVAPDFEAFASTYSAQRPQLVWVTQIADLETPLSVFLKVAGYRENAFLLESVTGGEVRGRYSIIGMDPDLIWQSDASGASLTLLTNETGEDPAAYEQPSLQSLRYLLERSQVPVPDGLPPMAAGLFGYLGYDMVRHVEHLPDLNPDPLGLPDALLLRPRIVVVFDSIRDELSIVTAVWPSPSADAEKAYGDATARLADVLQRLKGPLPESPAEGHGARQALAKPATSNTPEAIYLEMVRKAQDYIRAGDIFQVVPSQRFSRPFPLPPLDLYRVLRRLNPSPFLFYLNFQGFAVVGSSPEILVRLREKQVTIRPIAGTRPRGKTPADDRALEQELLADEKERAEHLMLLDLGRNDVGRVARTGTVTVTEQFIIERYSHVMHIVSNVEGELDPSEDAISALMAGFPAGTVSGAPKVRAMEIIDELELEKRGIYAGAVGYFSAEGGMDTCIALRTAVLKEGTMYVQAGGGVVADSSAQAEFQETVNKSSALLRAAEEALSLAAKIEG